ncbi:MAG: sigma-70 family RNA polymerase sigma factor [Pirellulaceae bacterium]|nr:sigma-70 family RNA polymerase sigma factor [Pirellulaceae bacterium]
MESHHVEEPTQFDLLRGAKAGNFSAFQQLLNILQPRVYGLAWRILQQQQDAEDATQQTFLAMIEHIADFREESSIATWAMKIASNNALKILRKRRGLNVISLSQIQSEDQYSDVPTPDFIAPWAKPADELAQEAEVQAELDTALSQLDDKYRLVFILRDVEGLSVRETAEALELTESTVKVRLLRARLALRERLTRKFGNALQVVKTTHNHS